MSQYRINWKIISNNYICHGSWHDSKTFIEEWIVSMNKKHNGEIYHWIQEK